MHACSSDIRSRYVHPTQTPCIASGGYAQSCHLDAFEPTACLTLYLTIRLAVHNNTPISPLLALVELPRSSHQDVSLLPSPKLRRGPAIRAHDPHSSRLVPRIPIGCSRWLCNRYSPFGDEQATIWTCSARLNRIGCSHRFRFNGSWAFLAYER
jgi:hypothetical protein